MPTTDPATVPSQANRTEPPVRPMAGMLTRRRFIGLALVSTGAALAAACQSQPSAPAPAATTAPAKPAEAAKPTEAPKPAEAQATAKPAVQVAATAAPPPTAAPAPAAQAAAAKPGGQKIYKLAVLGDTTFMDPAIMNSQIDFQISETIYNFIGRYTYDPPLGNAITPELAEAWDIQDSAKTWIFHLRKGVKFHKGYGDLTAEDVKFNWERIKDPKTASPFRTEFSGSTIDVLDPYTIKVSFDRPMPSFMSASLAFRPGFVVSPKAFQELGDKWKASPVGSGPFIWDSYQGGTSLSLKKNPDYWGPKPKIDQVVYRFKVDDRAAMLAVAKGELDAYYLSDPDLMTQAATKPDPNTTFLKSEHGTAPYIIFFNHRRKPFDDPRVRQALRYAIDQEAIAKDLFGGLAEPVDSFLPQSMFGYSADVAKFRYDPDKARKLLKEANVPADWAPNHVSYSTLQVCRKVSEAVASYWTDIGVKVKTELLENAILTQRTTSRDFDTWSTYVTRIDPDQLSAPYFRSDSPGNSAGYTGADDLIDKARNEADTAQRAKLYRDLQDKISQDSPAAFVISVAEGLLINKRVTGLKGSGWQERHDWFNVDVPAE